MQPRLVKYHNLARSLLAHGGLGDRWGEIYILRLTEDTVTPPPNFPRSTPFEVFHGKWQEETNQKQFLRRRFFGVSVYRVFFWDTPPNLGLSFFFQRMAKNNKTRHPKWWQLFFVPGTLRIAQHPMAGFFFNKTSSSPNRWGAKNDFLTELAWNDRSAQIHREISFGLFCFVFFKAV